MRRFFRKSDGRYQVTKELRERVLFSVHNLLSDAPFSRLDLVTCRNLLIYLKPEAQAAVLDIFHFALQPGGLLLLGTAENIPSGHPLFAPLDNSHRLFVRRATPRASWQIPTLTAIPMAHLFPRHVPPPPEQSAGNEAVTISPGNSHSERRMASFGDLHLSLLEQYAPPSVIVNSEYDIVHLSEHAMRFIQLAGESTLNLLRVVNVSLRVELRSALYRASHQQVPVSTPPILTETEAGQFLVTLHVRPAPGQAEDRFFLVLFEPHARPDASPTNKPSEPDSITGQLEEEIEQLRSQMRSTVEQYEASLEELKAANEEHQSVNEEMRSTAEELETSKEELESTNEELITVNLELKSNMEKLSRSNGDLQNLMASTEIGTIFLDRQLCIQRFTPRTRELFNLIPSDIGRPLSDITHRLNYQQFDADAEQVLGSLSRIEREVQSDGRTFMARLLPYRTLDDHIDGVVLTFIDISERKQSEEALRESEEQFRRAIEDAPIPIVMHTEDGAVLQISRTWTKLTGYSQEQMVSFYTWLNAAYGEGAKAIQSHVHELFAGTKQSLSIEFPIETRGGETRNWSYSASVPGTHRDGRRFIVGMALDITDRKRSEDVRLGLEKEMTRLEERNRMAQELHDTLAQGFTGIKLQLDAAETQLPETSAAVQKHIIRARQLAQDSLAEARRSIQGLRTPLLGGRSLAEVLQSLAERSSNGISVDFVMSGDSLQLPPQIENDLYRICQEALTNALRHASPQNVRR